MKDWRSATAAVAQHPRVVDLGRDGADQGRAEAFAQDLAAWLAGDPRRTLGPMARVVTALAGPQLAPSRALCLGLPLLAIEASARATEALWPWLTRPLPPPNAAPEDAQDASNEGEGEDDADDAQEGDDVGDAASLLDALSDGAGEDSALAGLLAQLDAEDDPQEALEGALDPVAQEAFEGARDGEELARTLEQLAPGIGWGASPGQLHTRLAKDLGKLLALMARHPEIAAIADQLGRQAPDEETAADDVGGSEEVTGVRWSGDVASALPAELALLGDPRTEDLFYQRLVEHRLVSLELSGAGLDGVAAPMMRGPVLACIDTSGSMAGLPESLAKALVLAVCRRVLPQGRVVHVLLFGAKDESTDIRLQRGRGGLGPMLDFLGQRFGGGTDFDTPLIRALDLTQSHDLQDADVLVVTDGYARAAPTVVHDVQAARATRGMRVWSVLLGDGALDGVSGFSDRVWRLTGDGATLREVPISASDAPPAQPRPRRCRPGRPDPLGDRACRPRAAGRHARGRVGRAGRAGCLDAPHSAAS